MRRAESAVRPDRPSEATRPPPRSAVAYVLQQSHHLRAYEPSRGFAARRSRLARSPGRRWRAWVSRLLQPCLEGGDLPRPSTGNKLADRAFRWEVVVDDGQLHLVVADGFDVEGHL